jgi:hypothetical protein
VEAGIPDDERGKKKKQHCMSSWRKEQETSPPAETSRQIPRRPLNHDQTYPNKLFSSFERILGLERHGSAVEPAHGNSCVLSDGPRWRRFTSLYICLQRFSTCVSRDVDCLRPIRR